MKGSPAIPGITCPGSQARAVGVLPWESTPKVAPSLCKEGGLGRVRGVMGVKSQSSASMVRYLDCNSDPSEDVRKSCTTKQQS